MTNQNTKIRIDKYLSESGQVENRSKVKNLIRERLISVNGEKVTKPGFLVNPEVDDIKVNENFKYVSRSAKKLLTAIKHFKIKIEGQTCADIGASTGGFTDVLLDKGANHVYAVDVGHDQLHEKLKNNPRITNLEGINARDEMPIPKNLDIIVADLSFISARKYVYNFKNYLNKIGQIILLFKPQFEVGQDNLSQRGVVLKDVDVEEHIKDFNKFLKKEGLYISKKTKSKVTGKKGNQEYLLLIKQL